MGDWTPVIVAVLAFCAMAGAAFVAGQYYLRAVKLRRRLPLPVSDEHPAGRGTGGNIARLVTRHFDERRFGVDDTLRGKLRLNLVRAGFFRSDAINFYVFWRLAAVALLPLMAYLSLELFFPSIPLSSRLIVLAIAVALGVVGPDAVISRKQRLLSEEYRIIFPDFLDLLVVCIDAGLTLDGAINRVTGEIGDRRSRVFGVNLAVMAAEMRAGRSFIEALGALAERLMIPEARSLVALLRQSMELGSDVGDALRVFGGEMREKRLLRAEEQANKLSVKMIMPMALFIMPVVLMVILLPVAIRLFDAFR
ncbi:MAG: type II secretion system F family protein [Xanthobacteraceae bacterium]